MRKSHVELPTEDEEEEIASVNDESASMNMFSQFVNAINPIDIVEWGESGCVGKMCAVIKVRDLYCLCFMAKIPAYFQIGADCFCVDSFYSLCGLLFTGSRMVQTAKCTAGDIIASGSITYKARQVKWHKCTSLFVMHLLSNN